MTRWEEERPSGRLGRGESRRNRERRDQATGQNGRLAGAVWEKEKVASTAIALYLIRSTITLAQSELIHAWRGKNQAPRPSHHVNDWGAREGTVGGRGSNARAGRMSSAANLIPSECGWMDEERDEGGDEHEWLWRGVRLPPCLVSIWLAGSLA